MLFSPFMSNAIILLAILSFSSYFFRKDHAIECLDHYYSRCLQGVEGVARVAGGVAGVRGG